MQVQHRLVDIQSLSEKALSRHGARADVAAEMANAIAWAEARGNRICGLYYLESYCQQLVSGRVNGHANPSVVAVRPSFIRVDADFGFAQPAFAAGFDVAVAAARQNGIAALAVTHAHTCTAVGYFTEQLARAGLVALGCTNASPIVAAPGGKKRILGTNPIAFALPGEDGPAMQFDFSTSAVALGKITMARAAGEAIPSGWAVDVEGQDTNDPEAALTGALVSAGGHKGWGFGLMVEMLAAGLTGGTNSVDVKPLKAPEGAPHDLGQFYILIDPGCSDDYTARFARLAEAISEDTGARLPGANVQPLHEIDVPDSLWAQLISLAEGPALAG
jgi:(2R)-3-sulfolactate dehydrogenase (NADP+)